LKNNPNTQQRTMTSTTPSAVKTLYTGLYQINNGTERLHYIAGPEGMAALIVTYSMFPQLIKWFVPFPCISLVFNLFV
jgi:hypothetical protein